MSGTTSSTTLTTGPGSIDLRPAARGRARSWSWAVIATHVAFVAAFLIARAWQVPGYSAVDHSVSDMYAVTAPHAWFLLVVITAAGVAALGFVVPPRLGIRCGRVNGPTAPGRVILSPAPARSPQTRR